ncbi:MAG: hypothetical protein V3T98_01520 [Candidatus Paceibacterota bacterium]
MNLFLKKTIIFLIVFSIIFNSSGFINFLKPTNKAEAFACANCSQVWLQIVKGAKDIAHFAATKLQFIREEWLQILRDTIVRRILDAMVDDIVMWIQGGGEPRFVTDWGGFMEDAFQAGVGDVAKELGLAWLCKPFGLQLQLSISYLPVEKFSQRVECTLDDIVANIEDFYENFENGGWIAYNEIWKPQNNFYGLMLMTHDEMLIRGAKEQKAAESEAIAGDGFLSQKRCVEKDEQAFYECLAAFSITGDPEDTDDEDKEYCESQTCLKEEIITPGDTIGQMAADAVGKDIKYIVNVKSYVAAIVNAIINRLFSEGLALMKDSTSSGGTSYDYRDVGYEDVGWQDLENQKQQMKSEYQEFLNEKQYILDAKNKSLSSTEQTLQILQDIKNNCPTCQPQPSNNEIQTAQSEVNRLKNEVVDLESIVNEFNNLIAEIDNISPDNRDREMAIIIQRYDEFTSKYDTDSIYQDILTGDKRSAANQEKSDKQTELTAAQNRINLCNTIGVCTFSP